MVGTHLARGYRPEIKFITCADCGEKREVVRWTDKKNAIVDSWGYIEDGDGEDRCHHCLDEGWFGNIIVPKRSALVRP